MTIEIGITEQGREASATALRRLLGETYALYTKTHGYHWNVTGPRFQSLHDMFMIQYTELWTALDEIAERIRALGHFAPGSSAEMMEPATIPADNGIPDAEAMIANLARGHEAVARAARDGIETATKAGDDVTADLMTQRATIADKTAWMLRSSL
ncbi:Dps family protein [Hyphomonas sp. FCG-A18]|uniref:Dps family protein n=1 Tax=Hyphomonas sp. FCG-A18 TaxID=3080019 RepID=UPI002B2FF5EC|nr:Dps family protein [Hyphomonas sp. FCG-A18]